MDKMLLAAAASLVAIAAPAGAQVGGAHSSPIARSGPVAASPAFRGCSGRRHHGRGGCDSGLILDVYGGDWAYANNRSFDSDSYNHWWHDRPDRAFPPWMQNHQNFHRFWWSGGRFGGWVGRTICGAIVGGLAARRKACNNRDPEDSFFHRSPISSVKSSIRPKIRDRL